MAKKKSVQQKDAADNKSASAVEDQPSFIKKVQKALTPNRHTRIESFGKKSVAYSVTGLLLIGTCGVLTFQHSISEMSNDALYTTKFQTSKTNQSGTINGVYSNKDHTRVMVMMKFENPALMSSQASNYRTYLAGLEGTNPQDKVAVKSKPSGSIIMFGQTGYMGLYLTNADGFDQQVVSAIMRADKQLVADQEAPSSEVDPRESFQMFDQWEVFFNPGGKNATYIPSLDQKNLNMGDIYYDTVLKKDEAAQRKTLNDDLVKMRADLNSIQDYETQLAMTSVNGLHVKIPKRPSIISGDEVTGKPGTDKKPSTLMFKPKETFNNGFDFDWRKRSVNSDIIESIVPKGQNYITWFSNHMKATPQDSGTANMKWIMSDGTDLSSVSTGDVVAFQNINASVQNLVTAYSTYYSDKQKYQSNDLGAYLSLELQLKDVVQNNNINTSKNVINFYG